MIEKRNAEIPKMKKPELLLPVRSWPNLMTALPYANAVYFGAKSLNMRARGGNFNLSEIKKVVKECHKKGIKAYLAVNSIIYPKDERILEKIMDAAKNAKVDAIICWDGAVIEAAKKRKLHIHVSTQANVSNAEAAKMYKALGAERVVLARECSLSDIRKIKKESGMEIETFVHGAMCVSISGRCYLSSYLYGKSANCGECLQPCRQKWILTNEDNKEIVCEGKHLMSVKDLCMIEHIPKLVKAGIGSFKIEGRLRDARYVEIAGRCYREALDAFFGGNFTRKKVQAWIKELENAYNRGFSTGFYFSTPGKKEFTYDSSNSHAKSARKLVGIVTHFYPRVSVAAVRLVSGVRTGDEIIIEGKTSYSRQSIESMEKSGKHLERASKGETVGIKLKDKARKNDSVYAVVENRLSAKTEER